MAKQLNINLGFTADISQAQTNIQTLQQSLNNISSIKPIGGGMLTKDMQIAVNSAKSLEQHLTNAFNMKTGNFDLSKLSLSLRQSGESLSQLSAGLLRAGENGERAFMNVQKALTTANVQINKSNGMLTQFANTLKNTVRWQLSSSLLHGFISGLNQAISYSKDLDKSLNNIRIVTGYSAEDMQDFAKSANEAAKALSSTTNEYAKASLIYFQQGLDSDEVKERTEATIKMANVSRQSAETVSDQMTAVWNNFDDGSKSLEYYADVMVKLGAETASSSDEIAGGLEKFASVGKTIGLSYEYAAAALATITARTRQSEDVVGTALKTIFARIQGLKLGETLEDGVELNKYSEALQSVGISIFEQSGEMKQMDSILNEMGDKWETLSKAQQVALAQTVAGVRQYTQLVALMDSWNDGEGSFQDNLQTAYDATGSLDKQQRTYEESWQAASKRIRASLEGIWEDLIPSDSIIGITDMLAGLLNIVDRLVEGFGGLEGIIMLVATIAINKMGPSIANGIDLAILKAQEFKQQLADQNLLSFGGIAQTIKTNFMNMFTPAATSAAQLRDNVQAIKHETNSLEKGMAFYNQHLKSGASATTQMLQNMNAEAAAQDNLSSSFKQYLADTTQINNLQAMIEANKKKMTQAELESLSSLQSAAAAAAERKAIEQETLELIQLQIDRQRMETDSKLYDSANYHETNNSSAMNVEQVNPVLNSASQYTNNMVGVDFWTEQINQVTQLNLQVRNLPEGIQLYGDSWQTVGESSAAARDMFANIHSLNLKLNDVLKDGNTSIGQRRNTMHNLIKEEEKQGRITSDVAKGYHKIVDQLQSANGAQKTFSSLTSRITNGARAMAKALGNSEKSLDKAVELRNKEHDAQRNLNQATSQHKNLIDQVANGLSKGLSGLSTWGGQISKTISGFSRLAMAANMVKNAIETLNDPDADFTSKLVSSTMALSMGFSALIPVIQGITNGINAYKLAQGGLIATTTTYAAVNKVLAADGAKAVMLDFLKAASSKKLTAAKKEEIITKYAAKLAEKASISQDSARVILDDLLIAKSKAKKGATDAETVANWANFASQLAKNWILLLVVAALALIAAATWAVVAAVKADNKAAQENAKAMSELNEKTKELADSTQSLEGEIKTLIDTFNQQRAAGEDVSDTYNELVKKLNEVKQNYKKLNVSDSTMDLLEQAEAIGLATGNWEAYNKAQAQAQKEVKDEVGRQAETTTQTNLKGAVAAFTDGQGDYEEDKDGKYVRRHVGNAGEDKEVSEILNKSEYDEIFKDINDDDATLRIDWDNESEFMEDYQLLANALQDMEIAGQTSNGTYQELKKEFDAMAEYAGEIEANMNAATEHRFQDKMKDLGLNAENIDTVDEYTYVLETLTDEMTNFFTSSEEARKQAKAFLGTFGNTSESAAAYNFVEKFGNKMKTAVNYKKVEDSLSVNEKGEAVVTAAHIDVQAKYSEEQVQQEVQAMYDYINGLPEEMRKIAIGIDLEHIDSLEEFKTVFNKTKAFEAQVRIKADPQSVINSAKQIRDDLSEAMESFSEQGYLTTTQAIDFLDEFPQYSHYLMETANGYAFTEEAIKEFNGALKDEKDALKELINPTNIGGQALYDFGKQLISLEAAVEGEGLKKFVTDMQDLTTQFIEGKIKSDEYFTALNDNINNLSFDENTSINDVMAFGNEVVPSMVSGIDSYLGAIDAAFEKGQIGAIEYRKALTSSANAVLKLEQKTRDAIKSTEKFSGIKFNEQTQQYERSAKWLGTVDQKTKDVVDSLNESLKRSKELEKVLKDMASFEGINVAATEDYEDLQKIFDEDFSIEIDDSELDAAIAKTQDYRDSIAEAFAVLDSEAQKAVINKIGELGNKFDDTSGKAFNMSTETNTALTNIGVKAGTVSNEVEQAAVQMLNGTYVATAENSQLTADAMGLILESGADTSQMVATMTSKVIDGIGRLVQNFDATIEIRSDGFGIDWQPFTFDILGKEFTINLPAPHFDIGFKGNLNGEAASAFNDIIGGLQGISAISAGKSGGGMSSFAPQSSIGDAGDVQLDEDPDTGGGGGGGSKGGGSKGDSKGDSDKAKKPTRAKTVEPTEKKEKDEEIERYYEINEVLDDINQELDEIGNRTDEAFGKSKIDLMQKNVVKLKELASAQAQYNSEVAKDLEEDKKKAISFGITFDEEGRIKNYDEIVGSWVDEWNATQTSLDDQEQALENRIATTSDMEDGQAKWSAEDANDEEKERIEEAREAADKLYEDRMKALEQYTETLNLYEQGQIDFEETMRQIREMNLAIIQEETEQRLDILERENSLLETQNQLLEDNYKKSPELLANIMKINDNDIKNIERWNEQYQKAIDLNNELSDAGRAELIQESYEGVLDVISDLTDRFEDMKQMFSDAIDGWNDDMQFIYDQFDHFIGITESYEEIMGLLGRSTDYTALGNLYSAREAQSREKYLASVGEYDAKLKLIQEERAKLEDPGMTETARAIVEENIKKLTEEVHVAQDTMLQNAVAWGEALKTILHNTLQAAATELEETLTGSTFDEINQQMEFTQAKQEDYLTSTNQQYETQKMIRTAQLAIEKTENEVARRKLELFKKETQELQNQERLSKYQLDYQQASYEVLLAEIALQEAQNTKSQVRLQRDSEGNFNYVYTADENKIAEAQQQYEDAVNNRYNVSLEAANEFAEKYKSTMEEYLNAVQEVIDDETLSTEQKNEKIEALTQEYYAQLLNYQELYGDASGDLGDRLNEAWTTDMMNNIASAEEFKTNTNTYVGEVQSAFKTFQGEIDRLSVHVDNDFIDITEKAKSLAGQMKTTQTEGSNALQQLSEATTTWAKSSEGDLLTILNYWTDIAEVMGLTLSAMSGYSNEVDYMAGFESSKTIAAAESFLQGREQKYTADYRYREMYGDNATALMEEERNQHKQMQESNTVADVIAAAARRHVKLKHIDEDVKNEMISTYGTTWEAFTDSIQGLTGIAVENVQSFIDNFIDGYDLSGYINDLLIIAREGNANDAIIKHLEEIQKIGGYAYYAPLKTKSILSAQFDTGGYTGEFGPEGKFAMLHEKELVLNADDTANLLDTIDIVRGLVDNIEYRALMQSFGRMSAPMVNLTNETLEQDVTIHAEFPNVQDKNEIEEAFNNLINTASQYANRKNR